MVLSTTKQSDKFCMRVLCRYRDHAVWITLWGHIPTYLEKMELHKMTSDSNTWLTLPSQLAGGIRRQNFPIVSKVYIQGQEVGQG